MTNFKKMSFIFLILVRYPILIRKCHDHVFTITRNLMKLYKEKKLTNEQIIFNYRLSRARRIVENTFGILVSSFRVLLNKINFALEKATAIRLAAYTIT